jgi:hypothetical protein
VLKGKLVESRESMVTILLKFRLTVMVGLAATVVLGVFVACHKSARVIAPVPDASVFAFFKDTASVRVFSARGEIFPLTTPGQRQVLHEALRRERVLWQARKPRDYRFLLQVACFCPGVRGWLLIEVRSGKPLRAWDRTGKPAAIIDWNTFSIDGLFEDLDRAADNAGEAQIAFDPRWHFPAYVRTAAPRVPDAWSYIDVRGLRPI